MDGLFRQLFEAIAEQGIEVAKEQEWDLRFAAHFTDDVEKFGKSGSGTQGAIGCSLNHRTIGDGVGEGNT